MHQLLEFVTSYKLIICPVCRLPIASCRCDEHITDKVLTLIALRKYNAPTQIGDNEELLFPYLSGSLLHHSKPTSIRVRTLKASPPKRLDNPGQKLAK